MVDHRLGAAPVDVAVAACDADALATLVRAGDIQALDRITRCHGQRLLAVGRRHCRNASDAEDAVQDALLAAGRNLTSYRGDGPVEGWLVRMVVHACHHLRRGRKNDPHLHDAEAVLTSPAPSPEEAAMVGELSIALGEALLELTPVDRSIVLLIESEGYGAAEVGGRFGLSAGAVRVRLHRARRKLRARLGDLGDDGVEA